MSRCRTAAPRLSHLDPVSGQPAMVDVAAKPISARSATAQAVVRLPPACAAVLRAGGDTRKGNVLAVARLAGIMAAKRTAELIPLCHQVPLDGVAVELMVEADRCVITASARCRARTGVEMEALTAAAVAALTVYDMLKAVSHDLVIERVELLRKAGGRRGLIERRPSGPRSQS